VLASLLCKLGDYEAALVLAPNDFYLQAHRYIYLTIQKRAAEGAPHDLIAVTEALGDNLENAGGTPYLAGILNGLYAGVDVRNCVRIIRDKALLREIVNLGEQAWGANGDASHLFGQIKILSARIEQGIGLKAKSLPFESAEQAIDAGEQIQWLVQGYIAEGAITVLSAKVKMGKTTLVTHLIEAVLTKKTFLNANTRHTPVVYLTEQPRVSFKVALQRANLIGVREADLRILYFNKTIGIPWSAVAAAAAEECSRVNAKLLVVDTLAQFAGLTGDSENDSGAVLEAVRPLQEIAGKGVGVLVLYHDRKSGGEVGDATRGSSALPGAADVVLSLRRPDGNGRKSLRVLQSLSRFSETPEELVIEFVENSYVVLGNKADVALQEAIDTLMDSMPTSEADALTQNELFERAKVAARTTGQRAIKDLLSNGRIQRIGSGRRGDAFRFFTTEEVSAQTQPIYGPNQTYQDV
jgi:hypothetical protein